MSDSGGVADRRVPVRARDVRYRIVQGDGVVIRQEAAEALVVNEVGARIIDLADGRRDSAAIHEKLLEEYEVEPEELRLDLEAYLAELVEIGVLLWAE